MEGGLARLAGLIILSILEPFYIKRAILDVLRHVSHIAKYAKYFLNIWTLHKELDKRIDKCTLIGSCSYIHA